MARASTHDGAAGDLPPAALVACLPPGFVLRAARAGDVPDLLTDADRAEAARGVSQRLDAFTLGRSLVRRVAADVLGVAPQAVSLGREDRGRPLLCGTDRHLSVTHTRSGAGTLAVVVVGPLPVGIDVEPVRERRAGLAERILAPGEALPAWPLDAASALIAAWTAKEAALKADGIGLWHGAKAAHLTWHNDGAFDATTPNGVWRGQTVLADGLAWSVAWEAGT